MTTTVWRWFPHALIGALGLVILANGYMIYDAYNTFPGVAGQDGFDLSNAYTKVLATAQQQAALGWRIEAAVGDDRFPQLRLTDRTGAPLSATAIDAQAERPVGPTQAMKLNFQPASDGQYTASTSLFSGQWDIMMTVHADGRVSSATRRVVVK